MANIKFYYNNQWDLHPITVSTQLDNFPGTNTQHRWKTLPWITPAAASNWIKINATGIPTATAIPMAGIFVYCHNLTPTAIVKIQGSDDDFATTPAYQAELEKGTGTNTGTLAHIPAETQTYHAWRIWIEDPANTEENITLGRVWLGTPWEPAHGYNNKTQWEPVTPATINTSTGGQETVIINEPYRKGSFQFDCIPAPQFTEFYQTVYYHNPFVIVKKPPAYIGTGYPRPHENAYYVTMKKHTPAPLAGDKIKLKLHLQEER